MIWFKNTRQVGTQGENTVDDWMHSQGWQVESRNLLIKGGEIDRIYSYKEKRCLAEIKMRSALQIQNPEDLFFFLNDFFMRDICRSNQIKNLFFMQELFISEGIANTYVRIFLVLRVSTQFKKTDGKAGLTSWQQNGWIPRLCFVEKNCMIFSFEPES